MMRSILTCATVFVVLYGFSASSAGAAPAAQAQPLDVEGSPPAAGLPAEWENARPVHLDDFESSPEGGFPAGFRLRNVTWGPKETLSEFVTVRRTRGGGRVLRISPRAGGVSFKLPFRPRLVGGRVRIQFDLKWMQPGKGGFSFSLNSLGEPVDVSWPAPVEIGPQVRVDRATGNLVSTDRKAKNTVLGRLDLGRWNRITLDSDLSTNSFRLFANGKPVGKITPFRDFRWFTGVDQLGMGGSGILLDNISVRHLPGAGKKNTVDGSVPPPTIAAKRLSSPPRLDGKVDDAAWKDAWYTDKFFLLSGEPAPARVPRTEVWLGYRDEYAYLAMRVWPKDMSAVHKLKKYPKGSRIWDHVEIFIDPSLTARPGKYLHFGFSAAGTMCEEQGMGGYWDAPWELVTHRAKDHWSAEMRVPFVELTGACPPEPVWGVNVSLGRNVANNEFAAISPTFSGFHTVERFARWKGLDRAITSPLRCELNLPDPVLTGTNKVRLSLSGGGLAAGKKLKATVFARKPGGPGSRHALTFRRAARGARQDLVVDVPLDRDGSCLFKADIRPADRTEGLPLAKSEEVLGEIIPAGTLQVRTDRNYYTHEKVARIRGKLVGKAVPAGSTAVVQVRKAPSGEVLARGSAKAEGSPFVVAVGLVKLPLGTFEADVRLLGPDKTELARTTLTLARRLATHNEVKIRWDNIMLVNNEPFYPIFLWGDNDIIVRAHDLGCNAVLMAWPGQPNKPRLTLARRFGIRIIARADHLGKHDGARAEIARLHDDPTMLAWFIEDEPGADRFDAKPQKRIVDMIDVVRTADPYHPTFINMMSNRTGAHVYSLLTDVTGADPYACFGSYRHHFPAESARMMVSATRGLRPIWQTLQIFHYPAPNRNHPSPVDFRHSAYSVVAGGATGIGMWRSDYRCGFAGEDIRGLLNDKPLWNEVKTVVRALRRLTPVLVSEEPVGQVATADSDDVLVMNKRCQGKLYVWLVNLRKTATKTTLRLPVQSGRLVNEIRPGGAFVVRDGKYELTLAGLQPMVLRLEK